MGFFDFLGNQGYSPVTDMGNADPNTINAMPPPEVQAPVDAFGSVPPQPSAMDRLWSSLGISPGTISSLVGGANDTGGPVTRPGLMPPPTGTVLTGPQQMGPQFAEAFGNMPNQERVMAGIPMPPPRPNVPPDQAVTRAQEVPAAPVGPPMNILPQTGAAAAPTPAAPAQPPVPEQNFLEKLLGGRQGVQRVVAGIGKGLGNIEGSGRFASAARGMGHGIQGSNEQQRVDFNQATTDYNNHMKMLLTGSAAERNRANAIWNLKRTEYLAAGKKTGGESWRNTPFGRQITIDAEVEKNYRADLATLRAQAIGLTAEQLQKERAVIDARRDKDRLDSYKRHGIDPTAGAPGYSTTNPLDVGSKFKSKFIPGKDLREQSPEFQREFRENVPPGAIFRLPGDAPGTVRYNQLTAAPTAEDEKKTAAALQNDPNQNVSDEA